MYDTVVLKSPVITPEVREKLLGFCNRYEGVDMSTGEVFYCFTRGELEGSYDYRIRLNVDNREWEKPEGAKTPVAVEKDWYVKVELSLHKLLFNHNVYGGPCDIQKSIAYLIRFLEECTAVKLPEYHWWEVERIDVSKIFVFDSKEICKRIVENLKRGVYSRRETLPYKYGAMWPGSTSTAKVYWKGPEYQEHDYKRFMKYITREVDLSANKDNCDLVKQQLVLLKMNVDKVLERAMRTLRFEVEIKPRKLKDLFKAETVQVFMLDDKTLHDYMNVELLKCIKEREDMDIVRRSDLVLERLNGKYSNQVANSLYAAWCQMVQFGENKAKEQMSRATFYRYKKQLMDAGISWAVANVNLKHLSIVPDDFTFLSGKYVDDSVAQEVIQKLEEVA